MGFAINTKYVRFIIISSHNFSLGIWFEQTKPMKLIGDNNQNGVFPADDSQMGSYLKMSSVLQSIWINLLNFVILYTSQKPNLINW